jgi:UrcA family protein
MSISIRVNTLRRRLPIAFAIGALAVISANAHADSLDNLDEITISAPAVKTIGYEAGTVAPIKQVTVTARVAVNPVALTTNSGVALLKDSVRAAAHKACDSADPLTPDDGECVTAALRNAKPQVDAAIARARSSVNG